VVWFLNAINNFHNFKNLLILPSSHLFSRGIVPEEGEKEGGGITLLLLEAVLLPFCKDFEEDGLAVALAAADLIWTLARISCLTKDWFIRLGSTFMLLKLPRELAGALVLVPFPFLEEMLITIGFFGRLGKFKSSSSSASFDEVLDPADKP
jgi:hypothetical protein